MSERADALLQTSGLSEALVGSLERSDVLFVLTASTLLYQDAGGTRRVTLRDLTRIHSDQDGLLRVETPAGTALTASLIGFDPVDVQTFFGQVRDVTARAKQAALAAPLTSPPPPSTPVAPPPRPVTPLGTPVGGGPARVPDVTQGVQESVTVIRPAAAAAPTPTAPRAVSPVLPLQPPAVPQQPEISRSPEVPRPQQQRAVPAAPTPQAAARPKPVPVKPAPPAVAPETSAPAPLVTPVPIPEDSAATAASTASPRGTLASYAEGTRAWTGRLRFLSVLLFLAALGLASVQFTGGQKLQALWVLIAGGIGAVALLALADLTRLLTTLAAAISAPQQDVDAG